MTKPQPSPRAAGTPPPAAAAPAAPARPIVFYVLEDWLAALVTFCISTAVFFYYMSPSVTLQDSGELVTGAFRFGVPHPSGYPLWALLGWVWRHLLPMLDTPLAWFGFHIGDPAAQISSFSVLTGGAVVALLTVFTKRGTLVLLHSIPWRTPLEPFMARLLALCAGVFAGLMFAFNRGVWLWSCVPEMRILSVFMFLLTAFLFFKWMMQPERHGLLLVAIFTFGLGIANHQTTAVMLVPLMGGALCVGWQQRAEAWPQRLRNLWAFWEMTTAFVLSWAAGVLVNAWLAYMPPPAAPFQAASTWDCLGAFFMQKVKALILFGPEVYVLPLLLFVLLCAATLLVWGRHQRWLQRRWVFLAMLVFMLGIAFYLYMPIAAATNPPMNWGFTATREGFLHHITRGQYQKLSLAQPLSWDFVIQNFLFTRALAGQFAYILAPLGLLSAGLFFRGWHAIAPPGRGVLVFLWTCFITASLGLILIINPQTDMQNWGINIKFFAPAHGFFAMLIAFALALMLAWLWTREVPQRKVWIGLGCAAMLLAGLYPFYANRDSCEQRNHDFGYQFGFRMFHPGGGYPDMDKDAVLYGGTDPGRFVPTYMIFCESFARPQDRYVSTNMTEAALAAKCATFDRRDVYIITQNALADGTYMNYIRDHYDFSRPNPDKPETIAKFSNWQQDIMRFAWKRMGRDVTYPKEPIHIPSPPEANDAFRQFVEDVQAGRIQPGADVRIENGRVSVEGVQGVMAINGILAKWIFEKNKDKHSFYVEESYVIPWMYPYLAPAGIIMKINKEPLPSPQQDQALWQRILTKDFAYWDQLLGEFIKRPEFKRDSDAQKAFSKLRCAIAGIYEFRGIVNAAEAAYLQAIAICPESPEASFRLSNLYMRLNRVDKAVETLSKLAERDPFNKQVREALDQFEAIQHAMKSGPEAAQPQPFPLFRK